MAKHEVTEHYFTAQPSVESIPVTFPAKLRQEDWQFVSDRGVFARGHIDTGTRLLAETMELVSGETVLDWGCGYGVLGLVAARLVAPAPAILVDPNTRACKLSVINAKLNSCQNVEVVCTDGYAALDGQRVGAIISNPPVRAGRQILETLVSEAPKHLQRNGSLWIVIRTKQGGKRLLEYMKDVFGNGETIERESGFRILRSILL